MTTAVEKSQREALIALLPETRDYGHRSYHQVVDHIRKGVLLIFPPVEDGRLPILRDARTHMAVKGSGPANVEGGSAQVQLHEQFVTWGENGGLELIAWRLDEILRKGKDSDAVKAADVSLKNLLPKQREASEGGTLAARFLEALLSTRRVTVREIGSEIIEQEP